MELMKKNLDTISKCCKKIMNDGLEKTIEKINDKEFEEELDEYELA